MRRLGAALLLPTLVAACANPAAMGLHDMGRGNAPMLSGPGVTTNRTPLDDALACYGAALRRAGKIGVGIGVGEVRDFTGKVSDIEGAQITQGGGLMVYSALAKLGGAVRVHERLDTRIAELELAYTDRRQLGDGRLHQVSEGSPPVPWLPYRGGTIQRSDFYIVGGVTELNFAISSGGVEVGIDGIGGRARTFAINVAVDLRIVDTRTLIVHRAVTLQKQVVGYEAGVDLFRFFGVRLFDINAGSKVLEPVQLAVRAVLEFATMELIDGVTGVDHRPCLPDFLQDPEPPSASDPGGEESARAALEGEAYARGDVGAQVAAAPVAARASAAAPAPAPAAAPAPAQATPPAAEPEGPAPAAEDAPAAPAEPIVAAPVAAAPAADDDPSPAADGAYRLQVASFQSAALAETLLSSIVARGMPAAIETRTDTAGLDWTVVFAGPFPSEAEASFVADLLRREEGVQPILTNGGGAAPAATAAPGGPARAGAAPASKPVLSEPKIERPEVERPEVEAPSLKDSAAPAAAGPAAAAAEPPSAQPARSPDTVVLGAHATAEAAAGAFRALLAAHPDLLAGAEGRVSGLRNGDGMIHLVVARLPRPEAQAICAAMAGRAVECAIAPLALAEATRPADAPG